MDNFQIETAQNISISQNAAGIMERILAFLIDGMMLLFYLIIVNFVIAGLELTGAQRWTYYLIIGLPIFLYFLLWETFWNGRTPGKAALNLRVVKLDGSKPAFSNYVIRWILRFVDITLSSGSVAVITILLNGKGQRLGDIAAGTTVISEKPEINLQQTLQTDVPEGYKSTYPQVRVLTDKDVQDIKKLYEESARNSNREVIVALAVKVSELLGIEFKESPEDFIETVIKDYNYFTQG